MRIACSQQVRSCLSNALKDGSPFEQKLYLAKLLIQIVENKRNDLPVIIEAAKFLQEVSGEIYGEIEVEFNVDLNENGVIGS